MSVELVQQILAPNGAPNINGVRARAKLAQALLENIFQGLVETNDRGITDKFATETEISENAQIFVNRILPVKMDPRELGSSKNGASFSQHSHYTQTQTVGIEVLTVIDDTIIIPRATQDLINVDLLAKQVDIYTKRINTIINGATAGSKLLTTWKADLEGKEYNHIDVTTADITNKNVLTRFIEANDLLDQGDVENGIDVFPEDSRVAVFKAGSRAFLKAAGILELGGANYAYDIAKGNAVSQGDRKSVREDGFIGTIDGVPCHQLSGESLRHASKFLGLPEGELTGSSFLGYVASSYANARGVSTVEQIKTVDAIQGQGLILQPFTKFGVVSWYAKGNVILTKDKGSAKFPFAGLKDLFSGFGTTIAVKLKAAGSRLFPAVTLSTAAGTGFTADFAAKDDLNVEHYSANKYVVTDAPVSTVEAFLAAYNAGSAVKGTANKGTATTQAGLTTGKYVNILAISDDGSVTIASKQA